MECRYCGCQHCPVVSVLERTIKLRGIEKTIIKRYRQCRHCGLRFSSIESYEDEEKKDTPVVPDPPPEKPVVPVFKNPFLPASMTPKVIEPEGEDLTALPVHGPSPLTEPSKRILQPPPVLPSPGPLLPPPSTEVEENPVVEPPKKEKKSKKPKGQRLVPPPIVPKPPPLQGVIRLPPPPPKVKPDK